MGRHTYHSGQKVYLAKPLGPGQGEEAEELPFSNAKWIKDISSKENPHMSKFSHPHTRSSFPGSVGCCVDTAAM